MLKKSRRRKIFLHWNFLLFFYFFGGGVGSNLTACQHSFSLKLAFKSFWERILAPPVVQNLKFSFSDVIYISDIYIINFQASFDSSVAECLSSNLKDLGSIPGAGELFFNWGLTSMLQSLWLSSWTSYLSLTLQWKSINYYDRLSEVKESYNEQNAHYCQGKTPKM